MYCFTDYDSKKCKYDKCITIVNLLKRIYYNHIKNKHVVIKNKAIKEYLWHEKECEWYTDKEANNKTVCQYDSILGKRDLKRTWIDRM